MTLRDGAYVPRMELRRSNPRRQGDIGEAGAIHWFTLIGATVSVPISHSPDYDLVAEIDGTVQRVQVKTSTQVVRGNFAVSIATRGGNQSWNGLVKRFDATRCDLLYVLVADGRSWCVPAAAVEGSTSITLGGKKYSEFEISEPERPTIPTALRIDRRRGSAGAGEPGWAVNPVPRAERVRISPPPFLIDDQFGFKETAANSAVTRISSNHQLTIPKRPFAAAELAAGDRMRIEVTGTGTVAATRISV
jgi:hypothetical protein